MKKYDNCIAIVCTENYFEYSLFLASQLLKQSFINYDVVICSGDEISKSTPDNIKAYKIETESFTKNLPTNSRLQKFCYWRIPAIEYLSLLYKKILYLDTDIYVNGEGIANLFDIEMGNHVIAAVRDVHQIVRPNRIPTENSILKLPYTDYFNAGLLLINSKEWILQKCYESIKIIGQKYPHALSAFDQSLLNLLCAGKWLELSPVWNWQYSNRNCFITEIISPKLIHFCGSAKFWNFNEPMLPSRYRESCYVFLHQDINFTLPSTSINYQFFKILIKNLWYFKVHLKYTYNFSDSGAAISHDKNNYKLSI
jgi:lipopolysaccharide biosynthesis glycosyltransferase